VRDGADARPEDLVDCGAVPLGSHDVSNCIGGGLKDFLDRAFHPSQGAVTGKPYAAFPVCSSGVRLGPS
jgi:hypothetical protein